MKNIITIISLLLFFSYYEFADCQNNSNDIKNYPQEELTVHLSQDCLFAGEVLWFKIYCSSSVFPAHELSSMAFIELINADNSAIMRKKILLKDGMGIGEFYIPENISSGIYYIISYTSWMKNFGEEQFFKKAIVILNPDDNIISQQASDSISRDSVETEVIAIEQTIQNNEIISTVDKPSYEPREKVKVNLRNKYGNKTHYSVAVYRKEPELVDEEKIFQNKPADEPASDISHLPDYNGIVLTGKVLNEKDQPVTDSLIVLSYPGPGTDIMSAKTDEKGDFHFLLKPVTGEKDLVITMPDQNVKLRLEESYWNGFKNPPDYAKLEIDSVASVFLEERYDHFQLKQKFDQPDYIDLQQAEPDNRDSWRFFGEPQKRIIIDDYIRLDSLTEYFWELIPSVKFVQKKGKYQLSVFDPITFAPYTDPPGVFVDGVLYTDFNEIAAIPSEQVDVIEVIEGIYYFRNFTFGGIVDIHTKNNDANLIRMHSNMSRILLPLGDQHNYNYQIPEFVKDGSDSRIPDLRYLICWEPELTADESGVAELDFFTSDVTGEYIIEIHGITEDGKIISGMNKITIKRPTIP